MILTSDPTKQTQEIILSRKETVAIHPVVYFSNTPVNSKRNS